MSLKKSMQIVLYILLISSLIGLIVQLINVGLDIDIGGGGSSTVNPDAPLTLEELKARYDFVYYDDLVLLMNEFGSPGVDGSEEEMPYSTCATYYDTENQRYAVVLLKDISVAEPVSFDIPVEFNFAGHTLTCWERGWSFRIPPTSTADWAAELPAPATAFCCQ